jgi:hypothetical protein
MLLVKEEALMVGWRTKGQSKTGMETDKKLTWLLLLFIFRIIKDNSSRGFIELVE